MASQKCLAKSYLEKIKEPKLSWPQCSREVGMVWERPPQVYQDGVLVGGQLRLELSVWERGISQRVHSRALNTSSLTLSWGYKSIVCPDLN